MTNSVGKKLRSTAMDAGEKLISAAGALARKRNEHKRKKLNAEVGAHIPGAKASVTGAPPSFKLRAGEAVFPDLKKVDAEVVFDVKRRTATAQATVTLDLPKDGLPILDLQPSAKRVRIDGVEIPVDRYKLVEDPDRQALLRVLQQPLKAGRHTIEISYDMPKNRYCGFKGDGVEFFQYSADRTTDFTAEDVKFSEQFFPTNGEWDQYKLGLKLKIAGSSREHAVMSNGEVRQTGKNEFAVDFPEYFTTSSFFLHLLKKDSVAVARDVFHGMERDVPVTVYGCKEKAAQIGLNIIKDEMGKLESTFGPWPHAEMLAKLRLTGGMETSGAADTTLAAARHETGHSYIARGVMPANGNATWIDEAVLTWHDRGYERASQVVTDGEFPQLSGFSPFRRSTPVEAYNFGANLLAEIDLILADQGGLRPVLADLCEHYMHKPVTTEAFESFVLERTPADRRALVAHLFDIKVFGGARAAEQNPSQKQQD